MTEALPLACATALALSLAACGGGADTAENNLMADNAFMDNEAMMANDMAMTDNGVMAPVPSTPQDYVSMAAASDMFEIESSQIATEKAQRQEVKDFAQMLIADHQKATAMLKTAAAAVQPPVTAAPQLDASKQAMLDALRNASAADFDRLYLSQQVPAHEQALAMLQGYAASTGPEQLKQHASTTAPTVEKHLARVRELAQP